VDGLALYGGLFLNAFLAATFVPIFSEVAFAALISTGTGDPLWLFLAATTGNVGGAVLNWGLGLGLARFQDRKWFPFRAQQFDRASAFFNRYGRWTLLLAWAPVIGDPLTLVAGVFRVPVGQFLLLVSMGKAARYGLIWWAAAAAGA
jgi:membrane protein YqaA with SNARE-associated domain